MSEAGERVHVAPAADLQPGERVHLEVNDRPVSVLNVDGEFYAFLNQCPHQGGPVGTGEVLREVTEEQAELGRRPDEVYGDRKVLVCPWHTWEFDIETGEHAGDDDIRLPTYEVVVEDGDVYLEL